VSFKRGNASKSTFSAAFSHLSELPHRQFAFACGKGLFFFNATGDGPAQG
jgi:hypothetical protein